MKRQDYQAVRRQLQLLDMELRSFKKELLIEHAEELEHAIKSRVVGSQKSRRKMVGSIL